MRRAAIALALVALALPLGAHEGWGIAVHDRLGVVVADIPGNTIWRITDRGAEPLRRHIHSHDVVIGAGNAIYGSNPEPSGTMSSVWRIDPSGRFSYVLPPAPDSPLGLQSFLVTRDGSIYSASRYDHTRRSIVLLRSTPDGESVTVAGGEKGFADGDARTARFSGIDGLREADDGTLIVADGVHLRSVSGNGDVRTLTPPLTTRRWDEDLLGISSVVDRFVYVADFAGRRVLRVNLQNGQWTEAFRSSSFWAPAGVEHQQALYILEHLRPPLAILGDLQIGPYLRVLRIAPDGTPMTLAVVWGRHSVAAAISAAALVLVAVLLRRRVLSRES